MAGEVCARCLWAGPATSAPRGICPVCGSALVRASDAPESAPESTANAAASRLSWQEMADGSGLPVASDTPDGSAVSTEDTSTSEFDRPAASDNSVHGVDDARVASDVRARISRGRWALLAVNVGLLVVCVALVFATALGWRVGVAGAVNASPPGSPTPTATMAPAAIPTTATSALLPTPTATTTPTPASSGGGGGFAPTATPSPAPTIAPTPTPEPTVGEGS